MSTAAPTVADFRARFGSEPAFAGVTDPQIQALLAEASDFVAARVWGQWYSYGVLYYAAHNLAYSLATIAKGGAAASAFEPDSKSIGGISLSRSGALAAARENSYQSTTYGRRYWELCRQVGTVAIVT